MAVARCEKCGSPVSLKVSYLHRHLAKQDRRLMCGASGCLQPISYIWLSDAEQAEYVRGERFFVIGSRHGKTELK